MSFTCRLHVDCLLAAQIVTIKTMLLCNTAAHITQIASVSLCSSVAQRGESLILCCSTEAVGKQDEETDSAAAVRYKIVFSQGMVRSELVEECHLYKGMKASAPQLCFESLVVLTLWLYRITAACSSQRFKHLDMKC